MVLAYTMEGLTSASCSGKFFGSPLLLHRWFMSDCCSYADFAGLSFYDCILCLDCLSLQDFDFVPKLPGAHKARVMSTIHSHLELVLVGATSFVLYPIHRCPRLLNQELTVQANAVLTPLIHARKEDGDRDEMMALEYIAHWVYIGRRMSLNGPTLSVAVWELQEFRYTEWYACVDTPF